MKKLLTALLAGSALLCGTIVSTAAETTAEEVLAPATADDARQRTETWLGQAKNMPPEMRQRIDRVWAIDDTRPTAADLLDRVVATFGIADANVQRFLDECRFDGVGVRPPATPLLDRDDLDPFFTNNLRLYYGRYLAQRRMFEESLAVLNRTQVKEVVDPATYLFFKAVCEHHLLLKEEGLKTLEQLTQRTEGVPARYSTVATLMQYDLQELEDKSLDEISRKMSDVERRLDLGRSGQKVQKVEDEIIAGLDEIIKKIEEQMGGGGGGGNGQGGNNNEAQNAADDSSVKGAPAPGTVDPKNIKKGGNWGGMDDKLRARVKQLIGRDFPTHYRRAVEEYFRNAAKRTAPATN